MNSCADPEVWIFQGMGNTVKVLIKAWALIRIITFQGEGDERLLEA